MTNKCSKLDAVHKRNRRATDYIRCFYLIIETRYLLDTLKYLYEHCNQNAFDEQNFFFFLGPSKRLAKANRLHNVSS